MSKPSQGVRVTGKAADALVVWGVVLVIAVLPRLFERCWSWTALGFTAILLLVAGALFWVMGVLIAMFALLTIDSFSLWRFPSDPPAPELDEIFPEHRGFLEAVRALQEKFLVWPDYLFRFGIITGLLTSCVWVLMRLPRCPGELHLFFD